MSLKDLVFPQKKIPQYTRGQLLSIRPVRNSLIPYEQNEDGLMVLRVPFRKRPVFRLLSRIFRLPTEHVVELDAVGSSIWDLCDGKHTVSAILERIARHYKLDRREAEVSLFSYLNTLSQRRYVAFLQVKKK
jgi:hypothetical protein